MKRKNLMRVAIVVAVALVLLCGTTLAYMFQRTSLVVNQFETAFVDCLVHEQTNTGTEMASAKSSIKVENTGNIPAYIRVRFVSYCIDDNGHIMGKASDMPTFDYDESTWFKHNDIYYCRTPVAVGELTPELLKSGKTIKLGVDPDTGYRQVVEVFADAIQSKPEKAVTESWKVAVSGENIAKP